MRLVPSYCKLNVTMQASEALPILGLLGLHSEGSGFAGQNGKGGNWERRWVRWHSVVKSRLSARLHARHAVVYGAVVAERPAGLKGVVYGAVGVATTTKGAGGKTLGGLRNQRGLLSIA